MDCFYAAVEVKHNPHLKGKPIGIGGPPNSRGVLCTASYEARKFGVRSAMPSSRAARLCPELIFIPPHFSLYKKESRAVRGILERFTAKIEPLSLDEAYLDVSDCAQKGGSATLIAQEIRRQIQEELNLTASAGIAPNKFLAKIASDWNKPNGQFVIRPQDIEAFMGPLKVEKIFGVGQVTAQKMHERGLVTCGDIQKLEVHELVRWFGSRGTELFELARGIDRREVESHWERKSLSVEETFDVDLVSLKEWQAQISMLYQEWTQRMLKANCADKIRGFVVKVKYQDFKGTTHEMSSKKWPEESDFRLLLDKVWERRNDPVRLIGIGVRLAGDEGAKDQGPQLSFAI